MKIFNFESPERLAQIRLFQVARAFGLKDPERASWFDLQNVLTRHLAEAFSMRPAEMYTYGQVSAVFDACRQVLEQSVRQEAEAVRTSFSPEEEAAVLKNFRLFYDKEFQDTPEFWFRAAGYFERVRWAAAHNGLTRRESEDYTLDNREEEYAKMRVALAQQQ